MRSLSVVDATTLVTISTVKSTAAQSMVGGVIAEQRRRLTMSDYIKREELRKAMQSVTDDSTCPLHIAATIDQYITEAPAADVISGEVYRQTVETLEKIREEAHMRYEQAVEAEEALAYVNVRKHGKWVVIDEHRDVEGWIERTFSCSNCEEIVDEDYNFCPNCGADMRGEQV
jgi:hypothetical protein